MSTEDPFRKNPFTQEQLISTIRIATLKDLVDYKKIMSIADSSRDNMFLPAPYRYRKEEIEGSDQEWEADLSRKDNIVVLSWQGSDVVGVGIAVEKSKTTWSMKFSYLKPESRHQGFAKKMFAIRLREILHRGGEKATVVVDQDNGPSLHIIEEFGFKINKQDYDYNYMELDLKSPNLIKKINEVLNER